MCEDLASEMYLIGLERERSKGISRFNMTVRWLFWSAWRRCAHFKGKNLKEKVHIRFGNHPLYGKSDYTDINTETYEEWLCSVWQDTSNRDGSRFLKKYIVTCNEVEVHMSGSEIVELYGAVKTKLTDSELRSNILKRGLKLYLIGEHLWRNLHDASVHFNITVPELVEKFEVQELKMKVRVS